MSAKRSRLERGILDHILEVVLMDHDSSLRPLRQSAGLSVWIFAFGVLLLSGGWSPVLGAAPQSKGAMYLENAIHRFDEVKDYVVDVKVHLDLKEVQMPDMEARVYYKAPDKIKIDSKGFFLMPKDVGIINPRKFDPDKFEIAVVDTLSYEGDPAIKLSLVPKNDVTGDRNILLTIDRKNWLIVEISTAPYPGREASAKITYENVDGFEMPAKVLVKLDVGNVKGMDQFAHSGRRMNGLNGTVEVYYSNYKINTELPDKIFEKKNTD